MIGVILRHVVSLLGGIPAPSYVSRSDFGKEFMQRYDLHLARAQGCGGFKRSEHSAVPTLVAWRFGGNEGLEGLERNRDW